ncbi:MAG TPA: RNA-directed DNA polymerase [Actinomycetota bacterium]
MRQARTLRPIGPVESERMRLETIAKPGGGSRVIVHLGERDRQRYEEAVASVTPSIERSLSDGVVANRAWVAGGRLEIEPWTRARRRYLRTVRAASRGPYRAAFFGDVRDCYGSITPAVVSRALERLGARPERIEDLATILRGFEASGIAGLPVGPHPSAVLANAVLAPIDAALHRIAGPVAIRWVDDVLVFTNDVDRARRAATAFEGALRASGLAANDEKCRVIDEPAGVLGAGSATSP